MKTYSLYLESGPKLMKTMVHVLELLGCVATGPTTDAALDATPDAIRAFLRFISVHGERVDPGAQFKTKIVEHVAEAGKWLGNGSPYVTYGPDLQPATSKDIEGLLARFHAMREVLASFAETASKKQLDASPPSGSRTARSILLHVTPGPGGYLSPVVGGVKGFSALHSAVERGEIPLPRGLREVGRMAEEIARGTTAAQRKAVIQRPKEIRTLRKALRYILEHDWQHLSELSRFPGGPKL